MLRSLFDQPLGDLPAQATQAAGDQVGPVAADRRGIQLSMCCQRDHDLAQVLALSHQPKRADRLVDRKHSAGQRAQFPRLETPHQLVQHPTDQTRLPLLLFAQIEREIGHVGTMLVNLLLRPDIDLADLDETALGRQGGQAAGDEFPVQAVQDDLHSHASRLLGDFPSEIRSPRVHHVRDSRRPQEIPLAGTGRGKDLGARSAS